MNIQRGEKDARKIKARSFNWISLLIRIAQNLIKRKHLGRTFSHFNKFANESFADERIGGVGRGKRRTKNLRSPSLHLKCASARAFPANLEWETTRYNESMRDHNHRTCCYSNCSVSYSKNAHRCRERYLKRVMPMMSVRLCTTRGLVSVVGGSRCVRRGTKASTATSCQIASSSSFSLLHRLLSFLTMIMTMTCSVGGKRSQLECRRKNYRFSPLFSRLLLARLLLLVYLQPTTAHELMKWKLNFRHWWFLPVTEQANKET